MEERSNSPDSYQDFFEEEDFSAPACRPNTLMAIHRDMWEIRNVLPGVGEWRVMNRGKLDIADLGSSIMLSFRLGKHEHPNMLPSIEIYKKDSEEYSEESHLGDILFFITDDPSRYILFEVYAYTIRKRHRIMPDPRIIEGEDASKALFRVLREMAEMLKREQDAEDMLEDTGVDFVSEGTAKHLKLVTDSFREYVLSCFGT